jgi:Ca-activated chloride channel family protein
MMSNFIPTLPRHTLYCVWVTTGDPRRPLECIWIDPEFRSFQLMDVEQTTPTSAKTMRGSGAKALAGKHALVSLSASEFFRETQLAIRPLSLVLGIVCFLLATVVLVQFCFGQGDQADVHVTPRVVGWPMLGGVHGHSKEAEPLKANVDLVLVPVTVTDQKDRLVIGLETDNFNVYDGYDRQVIRHISTEDGPISLGIIFDTSSSMYGKINRSCEAVVQFLRTANPEDEFFFIGFGDRPDWLVDFTNSVDDIQAEISKATPDGATALLDAVYLGLSKMKHAHNERKVLLIVSDGGDNHSRYTTRNVLSAVAESNVQIYAMGVFDDAPITRADRMGPDLLAAMTNLAGGRTFPVRSLKKIGDAVAELSIELRNQYLIAYRPSNLAHDGRWHKISVRVTQPQTRSRLRVYAKGGYYAPAE